MSAAVKTPPTVRDVCGTYGGYQKHGRLGETACGPCRQANAAYRQEFRQRRADIYAEDRRRAKAHTRAAWRLVDKYRDEWRRFVIEELEKLP